MATKGLQTCTLCHVSYTIVGNACAVVAVELDAVYLGLSMYM